MNGLNILSMKTDLLETSQIFAALWLYMLFAAIHLFNEWLWAVTFAPYSGIHCNIAPLLMYEFESNNTLTGTIPDFSNMVNMDFIRFDSEFQWTYDFEPSLSILYLVST